MGESYERLWLTIGLVQVLFPDTPDLERFIGLIEAASEEGKIFEKFEDSIDDRNQIFKNDVRERVAKAVYGKPIKFKEMQKEAGLK